MSFDSITNRGEYFSNHYLDVVIGGDLGDLRKHWETCEGRSEPTGRSRLRGLGARFFAARAEATEASGTRYRDAVERLNDIVIEGLGFAVGREVLTLSRSAVDELTVPVAASVSTSTGLLLIALDAGLADDADALFDTEAAADGRPPAGELLAPLSLSGEKRPISSVAEALGQIFSCGEPPRFVMVCAGRVVLIADRSKWAEGRFLAVDLDAALERNDTKRGAELDTIASLFTADVLVPGALDADVSGEDSDDGAASASGGGSVLDSLLDKSHKHAVGVSKDLRNGIRESIEILANEVIAQQQAESERRHDVRFVNTLDPKDLTRQCLRYLYRLLVLLYAEARPELGILPTDDEAYVEGYSLDRLRELCLVDLDTDHARNGSHIDESLQRLFTLVNDGYHATHAEQQFLFDDNAIAPSRVEYLLFPGLDARLFDAASTPLLDSVTLRNAALQRVLTLLMLTPDGRAATGRNRSATGSRGFISYATLGINQLGAVYEGLMAYSGSFAKVDQYEVAKHGDPSDGTWALPVSEAGGEGAEGSDAWPDEVFVTEDDPTTGQRRRVLHRKGSFVFRLSGRDRQRSASYYTPEVLTRCVVQHALAELLGLDDYAPEGGSAGIVARPGGNESLRVLDLTICEPALGSGAFLNEAINQVAALYLQMRQVEVGESLDADAYLRELQKVKAHLALHQSYGVDLNSTAIELAEVSLWLNAMYPGLKAPWFGVQLRPGNSLIGCRRAVWTAQQLAHRPWSKTKSTDVVPPVDVPLTDPLPAGAVHHFLLPGHGWAAVGDRKEAKELAPEAAKALKDWKTAVLKAPSKADLERLAALARGVEKLWAEAAARLTDLQQGLRRPIDVWRADAGTGSPRYTRAEAEQRLTTPDSSLGRLRTLMDAWTGLWFWPIAATSDDAVALPTWREWMDVAEALVPPVDDDGVDRSPSGQLDMFDHLATLLAAEEAAANAPGRVSVAELRSQHPWLARSVDLARSTEVGAWHWELEFAPVFQRGGFDLQVGNPPWVRPRWADDLTLAEVDPWWGITEKASAPATKARRQSNLATAENRATYLAEVAVAEGVVQSLGSSQLRPSLAGVQTNLYMGFMDSVWRHAAPTGISGLLHPESHFVDPKAGALRRASYRHLRRHWQFINEMRLFEDVHNNTEFSVDVYGSADRSIRLLNISELRSPSTVGGSLSHDGSGAVPGIQYPSGGWDLRPHADRVLTVTEDVLADWARLFDEPGTPADEARLLRPVTRADLAALSALADQPVRLADHAYHWTRGHEEDRAKADGTIRWETAVPESWDEVILQGPHFTIGTPFYKQPNDPCLNNRDYSAWDLELLPERATPRTNYQRTCDRDTYESRLDHWSGRPATSYSRVMWRRMTQPGLERSFHPALLPPGPSHVFTLHTYALEDFRRTAVLAGLASSLPLDYLVKVSGKADINHEFVSRLPLPRSHALDSALVLRTLRLNCLTADYAPLWEGLFDPAWFNDRWTDPAFDRLALGDIGPSWTMATPLRRDFERRQALVELDALAAIVLGLSAEQLCAMYRTQFAVLRKYEYKMAFDAEGRKLCGYHQSAGFRQSELQAQAKAGDLPKDWSNLWNRYVEWEDTPDASRDPEFWRGHYTAPFHRPDREAEMTRAYNDFCARLNEGAT